MYRFEDDAPTLAAHQDFPLSDEAAFLREADGLTSAILEKLCARSVHADTV